MNSANVPGNDLTPDSRSGLWANVKISKPWDTLTFMHP